MQAFVYLVLRNVVTLWSAVACCRFGLPWILFYSDRCTESTGFWAKEVQSNESGSKRPHSKVTGSANTYNRSSLDRLTPITFKFCGSNA